MVDKRSSYTKSDLEASGRGELFGENGPPLPSGNMLMMDCIITMTEDGGTSIKAMSKLNWISIQTYGSSAAILLMTLLCLAV